MVDWTAAESSPALRTRFESGALVRTRTLPNGERDALLEAPGIAGIYARIQGVAILEHERLPFPGYPYEWTPEMLHAAAELTLDLALELLPESLGLKDATPFNVLFRGPRPVFVDVLSLERRDPLDPVWLPYAQFIRSFLLPLLGSKRLGFSPDRLLLPRREGVEPHEFYRWLTPLQRLRPPFLSLVSVPKWLGGLRRSDESSIYRRNRLSDPARSRFILSSTLKGLKRKLAAAAPSASSSAWTDYMEANSYTPEQFAAKERFVRESLADRKPKRVLDVGSNTGHFSVMAAESGAGVVAIDSDPAVVGILWRESARRNLDILPLVVDLARPTPAVGWRNRECPSFLDRARLAFDAVLMLAAIHHLLVTERIPLEEILELASELHDGHSNRRVRISRGSDVPAPRAGTGQAI